MSIALVTGSTKGLGLATAQALAKAGHAVLVAGRDETAVKAVVESAEMAGADVSGLRLDVTDSGDIAEAVRTIRDTYGHLDILVNNAGILPEATHTGTQEFASVDMFRQTFDTNVFGVVAVTEAMLPLLRASAGARIVNVSSTVGSLTHQSDPESPWYSMIVPAYQTSKAALNSVTIELSKKLADTPIAVTAVCPGWVQTDLAPGNWEKAPQTAEEAAKVVVTAATLPQGATTGTFIDAAGPVTW